MTASDIAAWWGAGLATVVLGWDIYKWKTSGPRIRVKARPNMQTSGDRHRTKHVFFEVVNQGDRPATLTHLCIYQYRSEADRKRKMRDVSFIVPNPSNGAGLPHELGPGQRWTGSIEQDSFIAGLNGEARYLHVGITHSGSEKEVLKPFSIADPE